jgi:hypothetical protein
MTMTSTDNHGVLWVLDEVDGRWRDNQEYEHLLQVALQDEIRLAAEKEKQEKILAKKAAKLARREARREKGEVRVLIQ